MSGLIRGKIECVATTLPQNRQNIVQIMFKNMYDFFAAHPNYTLIALQYGNSTNLVPGSASSGTGTNYWDQPLSFGFNAFFVVRANATAARPFDVYYLIQWAGAPNVTANSGIGVAPGAPALSNGQSSIQGSNNEAGIIMQVAIGIGGSGGSALSPSNGNPWKGTSNANGADTKATTGPVWGAPAGGGTGVIIFPRSNDNFGAFHSLAQNGGNIAFYGSEPAQARFHLIGDDDSWVFANDGADNGSYSITFNGLYTPRTSLTITYPFCSVMSVSTPWTYTDESIYGDIAGTSNQQGGVVQLLSGTVAQMQLDHYSNFATDPNFWPNKQFASTTYDELTIPIGIYEAGTSQDNISGFLGQIDFVREMYNVPTNGVKSDYSRIFVGTTTLQSTHYSIPWDKETRTVPRSGNTRQGYSFTAPSLPGPLS